MVNRHKVSPERFRHLAQRIKIAAKLEDWRALARCDSELRELLHSHKPFLNESSLADVINEVKSEHQLAFHALQTATKALESEMETVNAQQERALAYQLAMTMEM
ncbi:LafD [Vibrio sp. CDRSL-10 TSBA]